VLERLYEGRYGERDAVRLFSGFLTRHPVLIYYRTTTRTQNTNTPTSHGASAGPATRSAPRPRCGCCGSSRGRVSCSVLESTFLGGFYLCSSKFWGVTWIFGSFRGFVSFGGGFASLGWLGFSVTSAAPFRFLPCLGLIAFVSVSLRSHLFVVIAVIPFH
jgi:hypothetical protein